MREARNTQGWKCRFAEFDGRGWICLIRYMATQRISFNVHGCWPSECIYNNQNNEWAKCPLKAARDGKCRNAAPDGDMFCNVGTQRIIIDPDIKCVAGPYGRWVRACAFCQLLSRDELIDRASWYMTAGYSFRDRWTPRVMNICPTKYYYNDWFRRLLRFIDAPEEITNRLRVTGQAARKRSEECLRQLREGDSMCRDIWARWIKAQKKGGVK